MIQQDSISASNEGAAVQTAPHWHHTGRQPSVSEVLSWLPYDATPQQQDSAVRANIKVPEYNWAARPNPMRTPGGLKPDESRFSLNTPMYHVRSMVQPDSIYRPEYATYRLGVAGDPVPYTIASDNVVTGLLLGCFIFATLAIAKSGATLWRQLKRVFAPAHLSGVITETGGELRFQLFLLLQTCLLGGLTTFFFMQTVAHVAFAIENYKVMAIFTGIFLLYYALKFAGQGVVQWVFFTEKKIIQYAQFNLFTVSVLGLLLFPASMLMVYFDLSIEIVGIYALLLIIVMKIIAFYKSYIIFFSREGGFLQNILYFCALELMPLGALVGSLALTVSYLKVNI